jgi:hypothetical protein
MPLEISEVGADPVEGYPVSRRVRRIELAVAVEPLQPATVTIDDAAIGIFGARRPRAALFEQVAGHQGGLPQPPVDLRPFLERFAAPVRILMKEAGHRTAGFSRSFNIVSSK